MANRSIIRGVVASVLVGVCGLQAWPQTKPSRPAAATVTANRATVLATVDGIFKEVSTLRGLEVKRDVKSGFRTRAELEKDVIRNLDEATTTAELGAQAKLLEKLGLIPKNYPFRDKLVEILTEQISGYYQPRTGEFFLAERGDIEEQKVVIAHELTHALQDQHFNLKRFENLPKDEGDRETAIQALIEGDATVVMFDYMFKPTGQTVAKLPISISDVMGSLSNSGLDDTPAFAKAPKSLRESLLFPYAAGAGFVQALVKRGGWPEVSKAFSVLPESTEQVLHPEKYFARERPTRIDLSPLDRKLGKNWKALVSDVNGEFGYQLILGEFLDRNEARRGADGWDGDFCRLYENSTTGESLLVQYTVWDTPEDAREFFDLFVKRSRTRNTADGISATIETTVEQAAATAAGGTSNGRFFALSSGRDTLILEGLPTGTDGSLLAARLLKECKKTKE